MTTTANDGKPNNIEHMHGTVQQLEQLLHHLVEIAREEFDVPDLNGHDPRMVDAFSQSIMRVGQGLSAAHALIDQNFEAITQEDVIAAFRQRRGLPAHTDIAVPQQSDTRGNVPLSELPPWDADTFDPGTPDQRNERHHGNDRPRQPGRHRLPEGIDLSVSPEERGDGVT